MPPKGKAAARAKGGARKQTSKHVLPTQLPVGTVLKDFIKGEWKLGHPVGSGGFGLIYLADRNHSGPVGPKAEYVIKVEPHQNGPLFCELHFYQRVAKPDLINQWMKDQNMKTLGMPKFIASGLHEDSNQEKYRFMVMERFGTDLQKLFEGNGKRFPRKTVYILGIRLLEILEYIHSHDYCHADIKASNLLLGYQPHVANQESWWRYIIGEGSSEGSTDDQVYLVDYGLAFRYIHDGKHKDYKMDPKWKHNGTIEFTSRDAHDGVTPSRRGDLEILAYCMLQWMCGVLPWEDNLTDCVYVQKQKNKYMANVPQLMKACFPSGDRPDDMAKFVKYITGLDYDTCPDYAHCKKLFINGLKKLGCRDDGKLEFGSKTQSASKTPKSRKRKSMDMREDEDEDEEVVSPSPKKRRAPAKTAARAMAVSEDEDEEEEEVYSPKKRRAPAKTTARATSHAANGSTAKGTAQSRRASAAAAKKGKSPAAKTAKSPSAATAKGRVKSPTTLAAKSPLGAEIFPGLSAKSPAAYAAAAVKKAKSVVDTANAAAVRRKKLIKASVGCQTSPGLKGLKRSRKS